MHRAFIFVLALLIGSTSPARAQWSTTPSPDNIVCGAAGDQITPVAISDGAGGVIAVWNDARVANHTDLFAQRLDAAGYALWPANGVLVDSTAGALMTLVACSDDSSGMILAWVRALGTGASRVWLQRVDANGQLRWGAAGVRASTQELRQEIPRIVRDGSGGAVVLWTHWKLGNVANIFGQRISREGVRQWSATGDSVATRGEVRNLAIVERPAGGAYFAWWQSDGIPTAGAIDASGTWLWPGPIGITAEPMSSVPPQIHGAASGNGVVFICGGGNQIYARGFGPAGATYSDVRVVSGNWFQAVPRVTGDGVGGAFVSWHDYRTFSPQLRVQHLRADGTEAWLTDGELMAPMLVGGYSQIRSDGAGGVWILWCVGANTWVQHVSGGGASYLPGGGVELSSVHALESVDAPMVPTSQNGFIVVSTGGASSDIWAKRMFGNGSLGTLGVGDGPVTSAGLSLSAGPNPARDHVQLRFALTRGGRVRLEVFALAGERVAVLADEDLSAGNHARSWDAARIAPGVYHARLTTAEGSVSARVVRVR